MVYGASSMILFISGRYILKNDVWFILCTDVGIDIAQLTRSCFFCLFSVSLYQVESSIEYICRHEGEGAILVFLTGWDEISKLLDRLRENPFLGNVNKFLVLPLHGSMPTINQREIFQRPPVGIR